MRLPFSFLALFLAVGVVACDKKEDSSSSPSSSSPSSAVSASGSALGALSGEVGVEEKESKRPKTIERLDYPGTEEGARRLLQAFVVQGADRVSMSHSLRPLSEDYAAVFVSDARSEAEAKYEEQWGKETYVIEVKEGQTELQLWKATTEELRDWVGDANQFPGGYRKVADKMNPGLTLYRFKFVKPGDKHGSTYDGLVFVNGHWVLMSKPYRIF